jgi:hypothetical protein
MRRAVLAVALLISLAPIEAAAQAPSSPRGTDIPRTREGKPDFTGIWQVINSAAWDIQDHQARNGVPAGQRAMIGRPIINPPTARSRINRGRRRSPRSCTNSTAALRNLSTSIR